MRTEPKPVPEPTPLTAPYWDAARKGELVLQRCRGCEEAIGYPRLNCPNCGSTELAWLPTAGTGRVWSYVVVERAEPAFAADVPYILAVIELDEGPRLLSVVKDVEARHDTSLIDQRVQVGFEMRGDQQIPIFTVQEEAA
ncbi:Zn-ribbon domain-containing OB-fold protein [Rhodococcus koreensis]